MLTNEELDELQAIRSQIETLRRRHEQIVNAAASRTAAAEQPAQKIIAEVQASTEDEKPETTPKKKVSSRVKDEDCPTADEIEAGSKGTQFWHADRDIDPIELPTHIPLHLAMELMTNASCAD